ncbi:hypothetical protein TRAPUB_2178 [Trametes pubescens]|uniref:Uncharacterized protein n=1 Tax=Trametes pubescens TaxID=154538 RepID=A0A1M2VHA5_TRAPU|nr:hypothetical protein TRAPUB_2178 [Trametes pubescens]
MHLELRPSDLSSSVWIVCGEDCSIQTCTVCASEDVRQNVVDVVMQRTLAELDVNSSIIDELTITLPACRHVFTVETLDGICELQEYYRRDEASGRWVGLEAPPPGFKQPPACPTCRAAITSPRYGRVFKRADLDILENNVASHMSQSLGSLRRKINADSKVAAHQKIQSDAPESFRSAGVNVSKKEIKSQQGAQARILRSTRATPVGLHAIDPLNKTFHSLPPDEAKTWKKALMEFFTAYREAMTIASTRSAHSHAWEASFAYLFLREMDSIAANPARAPRNPQEYAMRAARLKVGQPPPRADKRFLVEAFWTTLTIRLTLAELAGEWLDAVSTRARYPAANKRIWATYISFLLRSCAADAQLALQITRASESHRQEATTVLLIMRVDLEQFRFNTKMTRQNAKMTPELMNKMADSTLEKLREALERVRGISSRAARRSNGASADWLQPEFVQPADAILEDWKSLERSLRMDTFYQPVSLDELTQVVKAFTSSEFSKPLPAARGSDAILNRNGVV